MRERWWADSYELTQGVVRDVEYRDGLYSTPPLVGENVDVAGLDGEMWVPKRFGAGSFALNLWLGGETRREVEAAYSRILLAVARKHALVRYERQLADGTRRTCLGELVQSVEPKAIGQLGLRMGLEVRVPDAFWSDATDVDTGALAVAGPYPQTVQLPALAGADAPMGTLRAALTGPLNGLRLVTPETGDYLAYSGLLAAGETLIVDAGAGTLTVPNGTAANLARVTYTGPRFLEVFPRPDGAPPQLRVEAASGSTGATLRVTGRRRYLV